MVFDQGGSWSAAFDLEAMACGFRPSVVVGSSDERNQKRLNCLQELYAISCDIFLPFRRVATQALLAAGLNSPQRRPRRDAVPAASQKAYRAQSQHQSSSRAKAQCKEWDEDSYNDGLNQSSFTN